MNQKQRALVTGGSRGIGLAITQTLIGAGYDVTIFDRIAPVTEDSRIQYENVDLSDSAKVRKRALWYRNNNPFDLLVNNAGVYPGVPAGQLADPYRMKDMLQVNLNAPYELSTVLSDRLPIRIINVASLAAFTGSFYDPLYAASKSALVALTKGFGLAGKDAFAVAPGIVGGTEMTKRIPMQAKEPFLKLTGGYYQTCKQVADTVLWIATEADPEQRGACFSLDRKMIRDMD